MKDRKDSERNGGLQDLTLGPVVSSHLRWIALSAAVGLAVVVASRASFFAGMSYAGYCFPEGKVLSDQERIRAVVRNVLKKYPPSVALKEVRPTVFYYTAPDKPIHYKDADEFLALNPDCCELTQMRNSEEGIGFTFTERLTGKASSYARINYQVSYWEEGIVKSVPSKNHFAISNCGEPQQEPFRDF